MKTHHKALHRERQTKAYEKRDKLQDRWAQIVFHYVKHDDPISMDYYTKQKAWFKKSFGRWYQCGRADRGVERVLCQTL